MTYLCIECGKELDENNFYKKVKNNCKDCLNKKLECKVCGKLFTKKRLTTLIEREHPPKPNNNNNPIIKNEINDTNDSTLENHRHVVIGPSNVGKTYYMLKILEKKGNKRPIHIITRSPNQYPNYKTSIEIKPINE